MSNKEIVQTLFPKARIESHKTGFPRYTYYLVRNGREYMYMAEGKTKAQAWKAALPIALRRAADAIDHLSQTESDKVSQ